MEDVKKICCLCIFVPMPLCHSQLVCIPRAANWESSFSKSNAEEHTKEQTRQPIYIFKW